MFTSVATAQERAVPTVRGASDTVRIFKTGVSLIGTGMAIAVLSLAIAWPILPTLSGLAVAAGSLIAAGAVERDRRGE